MEIARQRIDDLLWVINSPSLIETPRFLCQPFPKLACSEIDGDALDAFFKGDGDHRVGLYFERLVLFYLQHVRRFNVVANQLQIVSDGRTIGELDFVFEDERGTVTHLETAVKFYLQLSQRHTNGSYFVGPNSNDSFEIKTQRLLGHQLQLSRKCRPDVTRRIALVKGRIHGHIDGSGSTDPPQYLAADHLVGGWLYAAEIDRLLDASSAEYRIMQKPYWLAPDRVLPPVSSRELRTNVREHFARSSRPLHVCVTANGVELRRIFILADDWPNV